MKGRQINPAFFNQSDSERNEVGVGRGRRDLPGAVGVKVKEQSLKAKFRAARAQGINYWVNFHLILLITVTYCRIPKSFIKQYQCNPK